MTSNASSSPGIPLISLGIVSDVHYGPRPYGDRDCPGALGRFTAALQTYALVGIELVVNLGDIIDSTTGVPEGIALCADIRAACATFPGQVRHVIGNHDVQVMSKDTFLGHLNCPPRPYYSFEAGPLHCVVLDGNCHQNGADFCRGDFSWDRAWIAEPQVRWLERDLRAAAERPIIVFCHECLDSDEEHGTDPHVVGNAASVRRLLRQANVLGVFQGHYHYGRRRIVDGLTFYTVPGAVIARNIDEFATVATFHSDGSLRVTGIGE